MVNVILSHKVANFSEWKVGFDKGESLRVKHGVKTAGVYTSVDNPNDVTILTEHPSVEALNGFLNSPELKASMENAGVLSVPEVKVMIKV
jgi:hypothetical protein